MGILEWTSQNWFDLFSLFSAGGIAGLWFMAISLRAQTKTQQIANLLTITANHREVWKIYLFDNGELGRVRDLSADTTKQPVTEKEQVFVNMVIQLMNTSYYAMNDQLVVNVEGTSCDIAQFLARPIPGEVWKKVKIYQNDEFVTFVESCRNLKLKA